MISSWFSFNSACSPIPVWREGVFVLCGPGKSSGLPQRMCVDWVPIGWYVPYLYGHNVRGALRITNYVFKTVYFCIKLWQLIDHELDLDHKLSWFCVTDYISEILWLFVSFLFREELNLTFRLKRMFWPMQKKMKAVPNIFISN